ncbi:Lectin-domain containing receptor kinase A4.3 [Hordeum vulgare]|nr:Lectin-domain containing receptor kinase A4.3 [Hordeum vulgare]
MRPAFVQHQVGLDLDDFPLYHVFSDDYGLEEEDEVDIDREPLLEDELATQTVRLSLDLDGFALYHVFLDDYGLGEEDVVDIDGELVFEDELATQAAGVQPRQKSRRTKAYAATEDKLICDCWRDIGQDHMVDADEKTSTFWIHVREFHKRKKFPPYQMQSMRGWVCILKRWKVIQQECNKFCATYESIKARPVSGIGIQDMTFKVQPQGKSFNLSHCWRIIKDDEKIKLQYAALTAQRGKEDEEEVGEGEKPRRR